VNFILFERRDNVQRKDNKYVQILAIRLVYVLEMSRRHHLLIYIT